MSMTIGTIVPSLSTVIPAGYLECKGQTLNTVDFPELAAFLGETGSTFTLPDLTDCTLGGAGTNSFAFAAHESGVNNTVGNATLQSHTHKTPTSGISNVYSCTSVSRTMIAGTTNTVPQRASYTSSIMIDWGYRGTNDGAFKDPSILVKMLIYSGGQ